MQPLYVAGLLALAAACVAAVGIDRHILVYDEVHTQADRNMMMKAEVKPSDTPVRIKFEKYSNLDHKLITGANCDPFGWSKCDPYFSVLYAANNVILKNLTSSYNNNVDTLDFGLFMGFMNPINLRAPIGAVVDLQVTVYDDDDIGGDELIGIFSFYYVVGSPRKNETKLSGSATLSVSFY